MEPLTLAAVSSAVVTEGIKFLYGQAAEAIKQWRAHRQSGAKSAAVVVPSQATPPPTLFSGNLATLQIHLERVEPLEAQMLSLRAALAGYVDGLETLQPDDASTLEAIDALRQAMEAVYQQRLTFQGEPRMPSGPVVEGTLDVGVIAGNAAAVEARLIASGKVTGRVVADRIEPGAVVRGIKVDTVGGRG